MTGYEKDYDAQLKQMIRDNTQFLSLMGHEIRTYMNAIIGFATILENENISGTQKEFVASILENGNGLISLTDKIVEYSRIRALDQASIARRPLDTDEMIAAINKKWQRTMENNGLKFKVVRSSSLPNQINTCRDHIVRCIDILLENALQYTNSGEVVLSLAAKHERDDGTFLLIDVQDTGCGIAPEMQQTVFEPFERGEHEEMTAGMGLAILACLVELLNGAVYFDSVPGEGSVFSICMPIETISRKIQTDPSGETAFGCIVHSQTENNKVTAGKILVVDDNYSSRKLMKVILESAGCTCCFAHNGKSVLDMADDSFDLVLMDIRMPDINGLDVTTMLREKGFTKPIIAVTAFAMPCDQEDCIKAGCNGYISKPLSRDTLFKLLREYLN